MNVPFGIRSAKDTVSKPPMPPSPDPRTRSTPVWNPVLARRTDGHRRRLRPSPWRPEVAVTHGQLHLDGIGIRYQFGIAPRAHGNPIPDVRALHG